MRSDYYATLEQNWANQKKLLDQKRATQDEEQRNYSVNYFKNKNGDGNATEGSRPRLDRTRAQIRKEIDQRTLEQRTIEDQGKQSWSVHYSQMQLERTAADQVNTAEKNAHFEEINSSWNQYKLLVHEYNVNYYPYKHEKRTETDNQRYNDSIETKEQTAKEWADYAQRIQTENVEYWANAYLQNELEDDRIYKQRTLYDAELTTQRSTATTARATANKDYYPNKKLTRDTEDEQTKNARDEYSKDTLNSRADFDKEFYAESAWPSYKPKIQELRKTNDENAKTRWDEYSADFKNRAGTYWTETTEIRSSYNTRVKDERTEANKIIASQQQAADAATATARTEYRQVHASAVDKHFAERKTYNEDKEKRFAARNTARVKKREQQATEMQNRPTFDQYLQARRTERASFDSATNEFRTNARTTRDDLWQIDIDLQDAWIREYYPNKAIVRKTADEAKVNKRHERDDVLNATRSDYYKELDSYLRNFFDNRSTNRKITLNERAERWAKEQKARNDNRNEILAARQNDRSTYDQQTEEQYQEQYRKYNTDIGRLRMLGYNQYARNKSASMYLKQSWRGCLAGSLRSQRSIYDGFDSGFNSIWEGAIYAGHQLHTLGSWGHHTITGTAYYFNKMYIKALYPMATNTYDFGKGTMRFMRDAAVLLGRNVIVDRLHDINVVAHAIALPVSWSFSNFILNRTWNIQDFAIGSGRILRDGAALLGINSYRGYVPVRQVVSNFMDEFGYSMADFGNFISHSTHIGAYGSYRAWMALYIPGSEYLGDAATGTLRSIQWTAILFGRAFLDLLNNLYAISSYALYPFKFGGEYILNYSLASLKQFGISTLRLLRDLSQLGYIAACYTILPLCRFMHDIGVGALHMLQNAGTASLRFMRDRAHDFKVIVWDKILVNLAYLLHDACIVLARATGNSLRALSRTIGQLCHIVSHLISKMCKPIGQYGEIVARACMYYSHSLLNAIGRFSRDRMHDIGKVLNHVRIPVSHKFHFYGTSAGYNFGQLGRTAWRGLNDWLFFPVSYTADHGFTIMGRGIWDTGVAVSRKTQDICTSGIRKMHDASFTMHDYIDPPVINCARSIYDSAVIFGQGAQWRAKKTYDYLSELSPLYILERDADRVLREHQEQGYDPENPLLPMENRIAQRLVT